MNNNNVFKPLEEYSVAEIKQAIEDKTYKQVFAIGDTKTITLKTGEKVQFAIADFDFDKDINGNILPITFTMVDCLKEKYCMNHTWTNDGGWKECDMREHMQEIFNQFPDEWKEIIASTYKADADTKDKLFLLSEYEVFGKNIFSKHYDSDKQYEYYKDKHHRVKWGKQYYSNWYWLRSPYSGYSTYFCAVSSDGGWGLSGAGNSCGVGLCFAIK